MKRFLITILVITSLTVTDQESVLLRLNYTQGDSYVVKVTSKQSMGEQGGMAMNMEMGMIITEVNDNNVKTESMITSINLDMKQAGMTMSYDSTKKEEELNQMGQMMKSQFDPMMKAKIHTTLDHLGNVTEIKIDPEIPGMEQITSSSGTINFPKEKVSVGSSWTSENEYQGMTMKNTYTVSSIANGIVSLDITGSIKGVGDGSIKGKTNVDIHSGISTSSDLEVTISALGTNISVTTNTTISKV